MRPGIGRYPGPALIFIMEMLDTTLIGSPGGCLMIFGAFAIGVVSGMAVLIAFLWVRS